MFHAVVQKKNLLISTDPVTAKLTSINVMDSKTQNLLNCTGLSYTLKRSSEQSLKQNKTERQITCIQSHHADELTCTIIKRRGNLRTRWDVRLRTLINPPLLLKGR